MSLSDEQTLNEMRMFFAQRTPIQDTLFTNIQELGQKDGECEWTVFFSNNQNRL